MLITGISSSDSLRTEKTLPQLTPIKFFPSSVILDKQGKVRKLDTGFNIEVDFAVTPFHKRFFAWMIDIVIFILYGWVMYRLVLLFGHGEDISMGTVTVLSLPTLFYHLLCEVFLNGQSMGKKLFGIKVITIEGGQPSFSQYLIRWVFRLADFPVWVIPSIEYGALPCTSPVCPFTR